MKQTLAKLNVTRLHEQISNSIRDAILNSELLPGDKVPEQQLADQLGVSRIPVREAIRTLEQQGLLETRPKVGTFVVKPTVAELEDGMYVRAALEELAVQQALDRLSTEQWTAICDDLDAILDNVRDAAQRQEWLQFSILDLQLHTHLVDASQNATLSRFWYGLGLPLRFMAWSRVVVRPTPENRLATIEHHEVLLAALRSRDPQRCRLAIRTHILRSVKGWKQTQPGEAT